MSRLLLFDIDGTLLATGGAGVRAMELAGKQVFGDRFSAAGLDFAGRLDPLLVRDLFAGNGIERSAESERAFRSAYRVTLGRVLGESTIHRALPGVHVLLDALAQTEAATLGLLTGNFEESGRLKLQACGVDPDRFVVSAWGDDSPVDPPTRDHLPPIAMNRYSQRFGRPVEARSVTIIGDTPHDVACAKANGCRVLAVATGRFDATTLKAAGADLVAENLSETDEIVSCLLG